MHPLNIRMAAAARRRYPWEYEPRLVRAGRMYLRVARGDFMPKILRGRISGRFGMEQHTADELYRWAASFERRSKYIDGYDDSLWLSRWAKRLECLAAQKERARTHKDAERKERNASKRRRELRFRQREYFIVDTGVYDGAG